MVDTADVQSFSEFLGISPAEFLNGVGLMSDAALAKAKGEELPKSPGTVGRGVPPTRGFQHNYFDLYASRGVRENLQPIGFNVLREVERKNPVVSAVVNTRCKQMRPFSVVSKDDDAPGFRIALRDEEKKPTAKEKAEMQAMENWFFHTGRTDFEDWQERGDMLHDAMVKITRENQIIDQVAIEHRKDVGGGPVEFRVLDGATIFRTIPTGYRGSKSDFDPRSYIPLDAKAEQELLEAKLALVPEDVSKIKYVQRINGRYVAAFKYEDMVFETVQKRTDLRYHGYGYSPVEQAMTAVTAFLFGLAYNSEAFNTGTIPKIALAFKNGNFSPEQLIQLQDEWAANFRGPMGTHRIPLLNDDVTVIDMNKSPRDMEYMKYLEFTGAMICAVMGIDSAEIGLRFQQAQNVLSENSGSRQEFSKKRGLNDILFSISTIMNKIMMLNGWGERYVFKFTGIEPEDKEQASKIRSERVKTDTMIDEIRAEQDKPPLPDGLGQVILDPTWMNMKAQADAEAAQAEAEAAAAEEGAGEEEPFDFGADEIVGEALDEVLKARPVTKARTLLV